ncbi:MAG: acyltransferase [Caulobacter sp.]|nr:acyltransferase [Caulobacter sp.]
MRLGGAPPKAGRSGGEIRSLNTVRGVAALMVAVYHAPVMFGVAHTLPHAYLGVDLFFVLSGFVIPHAYADRIAGGLPLPRFAQLRLARLYPLLFLATLAGFALWSLRAATGHAPFSIHALIGLPLNLLLLPAHPAASPEGVAFPFITQSWSIAWEIVLCLAYFAWARWVRRGAELLAAVGVLALGLLVLARGDGDGGWTTPTFWIGGVRAFAAFWLGVGVHRAVRGGLALSGAWRAAILALAVVVTAYVTLIHHTWWWADFACAAVGFPAIIIGAALSRHWLLENRLGDLLGEASFSVYLLHGLTIDGLSIGLKALPHLHPTAHMGLGAAWMAALVVGSWICWRWVETPLRVRFSRPRAAPALAPDAVAA